VEQRKSERERESEPARVGVWEREGERGWCVCENEREIQRERGEERDD